MTADGELYVDETCRDAFTKELDEWFGKGKWRLYGGEYSNIWNLAELPSTIIVEVRNIDNNLIGKVEIINHFTIQEGMMGKFIECEPKSIKLIRRVE
jgi:hypothetical protein